MFVRLKENNKRKVKCRLPFFQSALETFFVSLAAIANGFAICIGIKMNNALSNAKKRLKGDTSILMILMLVMFCMGANFIYEAVSHGMKSEDAYEVKFVKDESGNQYYALYVDGKEYSDIDYNEYCSTADEKQGTLAKAAYISEQIVRAVQCIMIGLILLCIWLPFFRIENGESPFQKRCVNYLRAAALLTICMGIVSVGVRTIVSLASSIKIVYFHMTPTDIFVIVIGVIIGMISKIFRYGCFLQEDTDSIA